MKYMITKEAAEKWGISERRIQYLCAHGKIAGAERLGKIWLIPETAEKPEDARVKTGRYIKHKDQSLTATVEIAAADQAIQEVKKNPSSFHMPVISNTTIPRPRLIEKIAPPGSSLTYIHADAGYGKTTLLTQFISGLNNVVWLSLDERDSDMTYLLRHLEEAFRKKFPRFDFYATDLLPFASENTFVHRILSSLLNAIGRRMLTLILDDIHVITSNDTKDFLIRLARNCPKNLTLVMAGRHELWSGLYRLKMEGRVAELTKDDLCFNREEAEKLWGFFDEDAYEATEGWALALQSYRMAKESGKLPLTKIDRKLYSYLFEEIFSHLPDNLRNFLMATSWLPELDPKECDKLLKIENSQEILNELVRRNLFTTQASSGVYRYHTLFAAFLRQIGNGMGGEILRKAMYDCFNRKDYEKAAAYALLANDASYIHDCISAALGRPFGKGYYTNLKRYFDCMEAHGIALSLRVLLARGLYLSSLGHFHEADLCIKEALPKLEGDQKILLQVMAHKARILRNRVSIEESNHLIDSLLPLPDDTPLEDMYLLMIEKIHNLTLSTCLNEALDLTISMLEKCAFYGNIRVRAWFERYLTAIYFYRGDYIKCLHYYEKSLSLSKREQDWLSRHCVGAYAAKAYQVTGREEKAIPLMEEELARIRRLGLHEEMSLNYLMYAEILLTEEMRKIGRGMLSDFSGFNRHLEMAEDYANLDRSSGDYVVFAKLLRMSADLLIKPEKVMHVIEDILKLVKNANPFFKSLAYGRIAHALHILDKDIERSKKYYRECIRIGEESETLNFSMVAYGELAAIYLREGDEEKAEEYIRQCLTLSQQYGHRYYFQLKSLFGEILKFAFKRGITPEFTRELLAYGGYDDKRVYINTLGTFYIAPAHDRHSRIKIRTQKSRELLAYLLEHREGVRRERIYADLWENSEGDITGVFHTRRGEIRRAFENLGAKNPIVHEKGIYRLNMEEVICDYDSFMQAADEFRKNPTPEYAKKVVDHYTGRYLDDLEALWAESARLRCEDIFIQAAETLLESYRESGERAKTIELLRRCTGLRYQGYK